MELKDKDLTSSLKLIVDTFHKKNAEGTAFSQLKATAEGARNYGMNFNGVAPQEALIQSLRCTIHSIQQLQNSSSEREKTGSGADEKEKEKEKEKNFSTRLHAEAYDVLICL